ncbi:MAG: TonB-dependent receptor [Candidatus Marinimicrobia bacterium]|nr:TonB-dependent receptor [Candidatus Neomarinimicrobiota bacterium]
MNATFKSITYIILIFSTMLLSQRGGRGGFNPANMPKIGVLQGMVVDSASTNPIPYASISIINMRSNEIITGGITDETGAFYIKEIPMGMYNVIVEFIGYEKINIGPIKLFPGDGGGVEQNLGTVAMELSAVQMEEVDVYGEIPNMIYTVDKRIFDAKKDMTLVGGTGSDALKKIPSVDVDIDGNVTLRGDGNVTILLDGRPMRGDRRSMVEDLPADMIDRIEVITNPSAKYDPDGMAGIINIILKRGRFEGINGSATITAGEYSRYNLSGMFNYRRDKFNFFTNGSYRLWNSSGGGNRLFQYIYPTTTNETRQRTEGYREPVSNNIKLGTDYYYDKNTMFTIAMTYKEYDKEKEEKVFYYNPDYLFESEEFDMGTDLDFEFGYYKDFAQKDRKLVFEASSSINEDEGYEHGFSNLASSNTYTDDHAHSEDDPYHKENNNNIIIKSDYTHPFGQSSKFEAGFKSTLKQFKTNQYYLHSIFDSNYEEDVHALYGTLLYNFTDQFGVQLGARAEQALTTAILGNKEPSDEDTTNIFLYMMDNAVNQSPFNNDYFKIYPSVNMLYNLNPTQRVQFGFSKRVNRPRRRTLTPFPQSTNNTSFIRTGNPYLKPEYSDVVDLNFSSNSRKLTLNTGVYYSHLTDNISWWDRDYIVFQDTTYEVMGSDNAGQSERNGIEFFINYRPMPLIMFMMSLNTWNSRTYDSGESDLNGNSKGYFAWGSSMITIPMIGRLDISGRYRGPMKITTGEIRPSLTLNLSFQRKFLDNKLTMTIKVRDLLDNSNFSIATEEELIDQISLESYTRIMDADRRRDKRSVSLSLSYSFGKMQQKRRMSGDREGFGGGGMDMSY